MTRPLSITIDIGTTNSKVSLFEITTGNLIRRESFPTSKKSDDYGELFDLEAIWQHLLTILTHFISANPGDVDSINISSVGEAGVLVDKDGKVASPLIAWYDKRSQKYIEALTEEQRGSIYEITGLPAHTNYSISKIKWLLDNHDLNGSAPLTWLNIPDLIAFFLTGAMRTEYSMASRTMCYDIENKRWSEEILTIFQLENQVNFPPVASSEEIIGYTSEGSIGELQQEKIAVRIAGHDHIVGALGINLQPKELLNSTGTTEGLLLIDHHSFISEKTFQYALSNGVFTKSDYYSLFSSMPTGGSAFEWYQKLFGIDSSEFQRECQSLFEKYKKNQLTIKDSLLFIPHLNGSGAPYKSSQAQALFYGLSLNTTREHVLFSLFVGLCLEMKHVANCFPIEKIEKIIVIGPAISNPLWLQLKADALNKEVAAVKMEEAVSFGALKAAYREFSYSPSYAYIQPNSEQVNRFDELYADYLAFYNFKKEFIEKKDQ
jgi:sugar (pentulose or hexulose) kinase